MATYLYRLGGWSFENRRKVLFAWLFVLGVVGFCALTFGGRTSEKFDVPGTESQKAQQLLEHKFPRASGAYARVVYEAAAGERLTDPENRRAVMASVAMASKAKDVMRVIDPFTANALSADKRIAYTDVIYPVPSDEIDHAAREELAAVAAPARDAGLTVEFGGRLVTDDKASNSEGVGLVLGYAVLAITLASLLAAGMPLLTAILGVAIGIAGLTALTGVIEMSEVAPTLATMLGLAVGIDYALFVLSRHRQNIADGLELREAAAQATATAGSAVVFAGLTVIIALAGLTVIDIPFLTVMGLSAAATVAIAVLIALTLLPALLGFAGGRIARVNRVLAFRPKRKPVSRETVSVRWARFVTTHRWPVLLAGLALLGTIAIPALHLKLGLPDDGSWPTSTTERRAYDLLARGFGPGFNGPLTIVVDAPNSSLDRQKQIATAVSHGLEELPGVAAVSPPIHNRAGDVTVVSVTPTGSPASAATSDLLSLIRTKADQIPDQENIHGYITGTTALNIDTSARLSAALPSYIAVVVGLALLLLTLVFRSIWVPIKAAAGFLLSIASSMGIVVWIFQDGHLAGLFDVAHTGPIVSFLPVLLIAILFGLAMDYEVFLVSRMRESFVHTRKARESVVTGFGQSGRVVTAAALIMTGVFAAFVLDIDPVVKSIALSLASGVLLDAFVVRMTLVPAVMAMLGKNAWWLPHRLDRRLPDVDIEGATLLAHLGEPARP